MKEIKKTALIYLQANATPIDQCRWLLSHNVLKQGPRRFMQSYVYSLQDRIVNIFKKENLQTKLFDLSLYF